MEILQLRYFYESAKCENFAHVAEKFFVPATAVSSSVKRLEEELGCKLFDRSANKITLNKNGKRFQQAVCTVFKELDDATQSIKEQEDDREIKLLVRAVRSKVTDYVIEFSQKYPKVVFNTVFDFKESDYSKYDIIIDEQTDKYGDLSEFELSSMKIFIKASAKSPLVGKKLRLIDLANENFITWGENSNMHQLLLSACKKVGFSPKITVQANDNECYHKLLRSGVGIGLGRDNKESDFPDISYLSVGDFSERYTVCCYYKEQANFGNVKSFIDFLKNKIV